MLDEMAAGAVLKVVTSKEGTIRNIRTFVNNNHCELVHEIRATEGFHFYIRKL
ncbi:MAG: sulfurtransferase TusA family protein [Gallionella sp.]|nr:sulfurtransferase TusA family protein [Gallionella sp.]